jgi:hypothetical protein
MPPRVFQPLVEVFLLVDQPRQRVSHWTRALAPLDDAKTPRPATVDAYFDHNANQAIFGLRFEDAALIHDGLRVLSKLAVLTEIVMIQPAELSEAERRRFVTERLARCQVHVGDLRMVVPALVELVRRVRALKPPPLVSDNTPATLQRYRPAEPVVRSREAASSPQPLAKGTRKVGDPRDPLGPLADAPAEAQRLLGSRDLPRRPRDPTDPPAPAASRAWPLPEADRSEPITTSARPVMAEPRRPSPNVVSRPDVHRANTVTMSSSDAQRILEASTSPTAELVAVAEPARSVDPAPPTGELPAGTIPPGSVRAPGATLAGPPDAGMIHARYLRGGRWMTARIGALSLRGGALMAVAMPRIQDRVEIALAFASHRALVRGTVAKISTMEDAAATGSTTFTVNFVLDETSRAQLTALLMAARAANVTIRPPPPRSTRRYPVEWPVCLGTTRGAIRAEALDVSAGGMFVKPLHPLALDTNLTFSAVLDDGLTPVSGRSRVVRNITDAEAQAAGLSPGYGLIIVEMPEPDRERWRGFLTRIEQRAGRRVLVGAGPARLAELQGGLVSAGYVVTGGSEPNALAELARAEAYPIDAAVLDSTWLATAGSTTWVESVLAPRKVPCLTVHGDARRARIAIDKLLSVV